MVGDARVVAIGENAHFVHEFTLARQRVLRFLAEGCGFTVFAFEFGFSEGLVLDPWIRGDGDDDELARISPTADTWGAGDLLRFVRRHNKASTRPLRFAGIDVPEAGGSLLPALVPVADYLHDVDPEMSPSVSFAIDVAERFARSSAAASVPAWAELDTVRQDALTATLARLSLRFRALEPLYVSRSDQLRYDVASWQLAAVVHTDYMLRAMAALFDGSVLPADLSIRDRYMADSVRWHLSQAGPDTRVALVAHNNLIPDQVGEFGFTIAEHHSARPSRTAWRPPRWARVSTWDEAFDSALVVPTVTMQEGVGLATGR